MDSPEQRPRSHIDDDRKDSLPPIGPAGVAPLQSSLNGLGARRNSVYSNIPGYTLMVAGRRSGKTSFLRLLLDTSNIAPTVSKEQLTPLAKFIQGSNSHTTHIRHVSVDVILDSPDSGAPQPVSLTLIDTPSLDFSDEVSSERVLTDILDHIDSRFADSSDDESNGNHHVHLCIYFLDPDHVVPPQQLPPQHLAPIRARSHSMSQAGQPIILDPPVTTHPELLRATLPEADITAIRRLSSRVNVLPIIARADILTNDRLTAVKMVIRRDLAEAGIGFGIFDLDFASQLPKPDQQGPSAGPSEGHTSKINGNSDNGAGPGATSPQTSSSSSLRLPYALVSADTYSHSEGIVRTPPTREDLVLLYTPSLTQTPMFSNAKLTKGRFTRSFRWGTLDILDQNHCDFRHLRMAIFHHMKTLQKYTKEYLYEKYKMEAPSHGHPLQRHQNPRPHHMPLPRNHRPLMTIDVAPHPNGGPVRHPPLVLPPPSLPHNGEMMNSPMPIRPNSTKMAGSTGKSQRTRSKKITVACNFCRSRKLKCDGGKPACGQCFKRSNTCDYIPHSKRRGAGRTRKLPEDESASELDSGDEAGGGADMDGGSASRSPEVSTISVNRVNGNNLEQAGGPMNHLSEIRRAVGPPHHDPHAPRLSPVVHGSSMLPDDNGGLPPHPGAGIAPSHHYRPYPGLNHAGNQDLPPITTLPVNGTLRSEDSVLPPIISISDQHLSHSPNQQPLSHPPSGTPTGTGQILDGQQLGRPRKRASTTGSGRGSRSHYASKIVACNFCRARKTRCDGEHPACGACSRRSLACSYVNDPSPVMGVGPGPSGTGKRKSVGDSPDERPIMDHHLDRERDRDDRSGPPPLSALSASVPSSVIPTPTSGGPSGATPTKSLSPPGGSHYGLHGHSNTYPPPPPPPLKAPPQPFGLSGERSNKSGGASDSGHSDGSEGVKRGAGPIELDGMVPTKKMRYGD